MTKFRFFMLAGLLITGMFGVMSLQAIDEKAAPLTVTMKNVADETIGTVIFEQVTEDTVRVAARLENLTPGFHGFHFHSTGLCEKDLDSPFSSAGGHFNPDGTLHGEHAGDSPSLLVMENGMAELIFLTDRFSLKELQDNDGSAVIIHSNSDNYANIPERYGDADDATLGTGDAGSRVGCGVIR